MGKRISPSELNLVANCEFDNGCIAVFKRLCGVYPQLFVLSCVDIEKMWSHLAGFQSIEAMAGGC